MANTQGTGYGLRPLDQPYGNRAVRYFKADTGQAIYLYQPVALNANGYVGVASSPACPILGVAVEFLDANKASLPSGTTGMTNLQAGSYLQASTDAQVGVLTDPNQYYIMEEGTGGTALTNSAVGNGVIFTYEATSGNTTTGIANIVISQSSLTATTLNSLQIMALADGVSQDGTMNSTGNFCKWIVRITNHQAGPQTLAVPV